MMLAMEKYLFWKCIKKVCEGYLLYSLWHWRRLQLFFLHAERDHLCPAGSGETNEENSITQAVQARG